VVFFCLAFIFYLLARRLLPSLLAIHWKGEPLVIIDQISRLWQHYYPGIPINLSLTANQTLNLIDYKAGFDTTGGKQLVHSSHLGNGKGYPNQVGTRVALHEAGLPPPPKLRDILVGEQHHLNLMEAHKVLPRSAAQERADVVRYLRGKGWRILAYSIEQGAHCRG
jgi:hypothetical protein